MKIIVSQDRLAQALAVVSKAISNRSTVPILSGILIRAEGNQLTLSATDHQISIEKTVEAQVAENGSIVLPGRYFGEIVRRIPADKFEMAVNYGNQTALIFWPSSQYEIHGFPAEEFPLLPRPTADRIITIRQAVLRNLIRQTNYAVSHDETRPILTGAYFRVEGNWAEMVATDGVRMAHTKGQTVHHLEGEPWQTIIPGRALAELVRILDDEGEDLEMTFNLSQVFFRLPGMMFATRVIEGRFVNFRQATPREFMATCKLNNQVFLNALERAALIADQSGQLLLNVQEDKILITSNSPEVGKVYEEVPAERNGENIELVFNPRYLIDALRNIEYSEVLFEISGPLSPCKLRGTAFDVPYAVVLPIRTF